ncbi:hypothetical protein ACM26V_03870 [Salipaludibacillus sp. HK11]
MEIALLIFFVLVFIVGAKVSEKIIKRQDKQIELLEEIISKNDHNNEKK